jgi:hypothetical protein
MSALNLGRQSAGATRAGRRVQFVGSYGLRTAKSMTSVVNIAAMEALAAVIFLEKLRRRRPWLA